MNAKLEEILNFLNDQKIRATYGAVAECIGTVAIAMGGILGDKDHRHSFVVSGGDGLPTGYGPAERHPDLESNSEIIRSCEDLRRRMKDAAKNS